MKTFKKVSSKSNLEQEYLEYLKNDTIRVISFDIFETLVYRKVRQANDLFNQIAKHKYVKNVFFTKESFISSRVEAEKTARKLNSKNEDVNLNLIYKQLPITKKQRLKIIKIELQTEERNLYINKQIIQWIKLADKYKKKIILTSDTYFSSNELDSLVFSKLNNKNIISERYVSNEHNLTKATGNLYTKILKDLSIDASQLLHIGDNKYSDIEMAKQKNINTIHYASSKYIDELFKIEQSYIPPLKKNHNYRIQASLLNSYKSEDEKFFFDLGAVVFGPILWEFSHWMIKLAKSKNISQINCVMREGRIFKKCISKINTDLDLNLIYASRKSTFAPAIDIDMIKEKGIDFLSHRDSNMHNSSQLKDIKTTVLKQKKLFKKYLKQLNYKRKSILIDFGGTGSILKNIENILSSKKKEQLNVLFYIHSAGVRKMHDSKIFSFLPLKDTTNKDIELIRRNHEFIEILFNGINSTTLNYIQKNNKIKAQLSSNSSPKLNKTKIKAFDKGIDAFFSICIKNQLKSNLYSRKNLLSMLSRLIQVPSLDEAVNLGNLYHDESYTNSKKIITSKNRKTIEKIGLEKSLYSNNTSPSFQSAKISWVNGVITQLDNKYIQNINSVSTQGINSDSITKILEVLDQNQSIKELYVYGAGELFKELLPLLLKRRINIKALIDTRAKISSFTMLGYKVTSLEEITLHDGDCIVVSSVVFSDEITKAIIKYAQDKKIKIINFSSNLIEIN